MCLHHYLQDGRTPLERAKQRGKHSIVDYLVTVGEYCYAHGCYTCYHDNMVCIRYTMPTRGVSRIHEAITINC